MNIGELAKATGLTTKTIRFYEEAGVLPGPPRTLSGYRVYRVEDIPRLEFIRKARRLGLSLEEVRGILGLHDRSEPTCLHVRSLLEEKLAQVERALEDLQGLRAELAQLRDQAGTMEDCRPSGGGICGIIEGSGVAVAGKALVRGLSLPAAKPATRPQRRGQL
jgi:DNA-binding transcriptional MerR regulator